MRERNPAQQKDFQYWQGFNYIVVKILACLRLVTIYLIIILYLCYCSNSIIL